jgi:hypothetical protein
MMFSNIRYTTLKTPGFTAVVILTLAFGIGANAALFSVADALILRPLPFKNADRLVRVTADLTKQGIKDVGLSFRAYGALCLAPIHLPPAYAGENSPILDSHRRPLFFRADLKTPQYGKDPRLTAGVTPPRVVMPEIC